MVDALLAQSETTFTIVDDQNNLVFLNNSARNVALDFAGELPKTGEPLAKYIAPDLLGALLLDIQTVRGGGEAKRTVFSNNVNPRGKITFFSYKLTRLEKDGLILMEAVSLDVVEHLQKDIAERQNYLNHIFDTVGTGINVCDEDGNIVDTNATYQTMVGKTAKQLLGVSMVECLHPDEQVLASEQFLLFIKEGILPKRNWQIRHTSGSHLLTDVAVSKITINKEVRIIFSVTDLSVQKNLEKKLRKNSQQTEALLNNLPILLWSVNGDLKLETANKSAKTYFRQNLSYPFKKGDKASLFSALHTDTRGESTPVDYNRVLTTGISQKLKVLDYFQGQLIHFSGRMYPVISAGVTTGITCYLENDTRSFLRRKLSAGLAKFFTHCAGAKNTNEVFRFLVEDILSQLYVEEGEVVVLKDQILKPNVVYRKGKFSQTPNIPELEYFQLQLGEGIIGACAKSKSTIVIKDSAQDKRVISVHQTFASEIAVPVIVDGNTFAVINCESNALGFFKPIFKEVLESASQEAARQISKLLSEEKIKSIESLHGAILNSTPNGFLLIDKEFKIQSFNKTAGIMLSNYSQTPIVRGVSYLNYTPTHEHEAFKAATKKSFQGELVKAERLVEHPLKGEVWILFTFAPAVSSDNKIFGVTLIIENIDHAKKAEQTILQQNFDLKKANKELDNFVYSISHDVRAPLSSIEGLSNLIKMSESIDEVKEYAGFIVESTQKLDNFIRNILAYSRNKRKQNEPESLFLEEEVKKAIKANRFIKGFKNVDFKLKIDKDIVRIDPFRFRIIMEGVISNAIKYHDSKKEDQFISILIEKRDGTLYIEVEDNGQGIEEKMLPKIFDMFFIANKKAEGNGIGLYILKETIEFLKGSIEVKSIFGNGTKIEITLPL